MRRAWPFSGVSRASGAFGASARPGRSCKGGSIRARSAAPHGVRGIRQRDVCQKNRRQGNVARGCGEGLRVRDVRVGGSPGPASGAHRRSRIRGATSGASDWKPLETKTTSFSFLELIQTIDTAAARLGQVENRVQNNENPLSAGKSS